MPFYCEFFVNLNMKFENERENIGIAAVKKLRKEKHEMGFPFLINDETLSDYECYFEYPDGSIFLMKLIPSKRDFDKIRKLTPSEAELLLEENYLNN